MNNPTINTGNQNSINVNRPTIVNNRPTTINQNNWNNYTNIHNTNVQNTTLQNTNVNVNRSYGGAYWGANGNWRGSYGNLHADCYHGSWPYWNSRGAGWFAAGTAFGWLISPGQTIAYSNPY